MKKSELNSTQEKQDISTNRSENPNNIPEKIQQQSGYKQIYLSWMEKVKIPYNDNTIHKKLSSHNINYVPDKFHLGNQMQILSIDTTNSLQAIGLKIAFSQFIFEINILNIDADNDDNDYFFAQGSFGKVSAFKYSNHQNIAIKKCKIKQTHKNHSCYAQFLKKIIMQLFFTKFMSALEYGPAFKQILGFDLIFYNDCAEFALQFCQSQKFSSLWKNIFEDLPKGLKLMHKFHIIHGDIKPQNILFSPTFNRFVFCDYGLSRFINQSIGQKTLTSYFGTYNYVSEEMGELLKNCDIKKSNYVDLYYNDLYGLKTTMSNFFLLIQNSMIGLNESIEDYLNQFPYRYQLAILKFRLFRKQCHSIQTIEQFEEDILKFLLQMKPSEYLYAFFIRHFGRCCNTITKYEFYQQTLRETYTQRGINNKPFPINQNNKMKNLQKYQIFQEKLAQQQKNLNKNDCIIKDIIKIITGVAQINSLDQYCLLLSLFLNFYEEQAWSQNIIKAIEYFQSKIQLQIFLTENEQLSAYFRSRCLKNNQRYYTWIISAQSDIKLINMSYKLEQYFYLTSNVVGLNRMANFRYQFFANFQHYNYLIENILVIQNQRKLYNNINETMLLNFLPNFTPFRINNDEKWFQMQIYKSLLNVLDQKEIILRSNLEKLIYLSSFYGKNVDTINNNFCEQFQNMTYEGIFSNLYHIITKAMLVNIYYNVDNFTQGIAALNQIESNNRFFDEQITSAINYFLRRSFYIFYIKISSKKALYLFNQMIKIPQKFTTLWNFCHANEYLNAKMIQQQFSAVNYYTKIVIAQLSHRSSNKFLLFTYDPKILNTKKGVEYFLSRYENFSAKFFKYLIEQLQSPSKVKTIKNFLVYIKHLTLQVQNCHRSETIKKDCILTFSLLKPYQHSFDVFLQNQFHYLQAYFNLQNGNLTLIIQSYEKNQIIDSCQKGSDVHIRFLILVSLAYYWTFNQQKAGKIATQVYSLILTSNRLFLLNFSPDFIIILQKFSLSTLPEYVNFLKILMKQSATDDIWGFKSLDYVFDLLKVEQQKQLIRIVNYFLQQKYYLKTHFEYHKISLLILENIKFFYSDVNEHISLLKKIALTLDTFSKYKNVELFKHYFTEICEILSKCKSKRKKSWVSLRFLKNSKKVTIKNKKNPIWKHFLQALNKKIIKRSSNKKDQNSKNKIKFQNRQVVQVEASQSEVQDELFQL